VWGLKFLFKYSKGVPNELPFFMKKTGKRDEVFEYQKWDFNHQWLAQIDITLLAMYGILPIDATKENSC
jgi:hypothetical protein